MKQRKVYKDANGNLYGIERAVRNGRWVVIRTNLGGNRKAAKEFCVSADPDAVQNLLDIHAERHGWETV